MRPSSVHLRSNRSRVQYIHSRPSRTYANRHNSPFPCPRRYCTRTYGRHRRIHIWDKLRPSRRHTPGRSILRGISHTTPTLLQGIHTLRIVPSYDVTVHSQVWPPASSIKRVSENKKCRLDVVLADLVVGVEMEDDGTDRVKALCQVVGVACVQLFFSHGY